MKKDSYPIGSKVIFSLYDALESKSWSGYDTMSQAKSYPKLFGGKIGEYSASGGFVRISYRDITDCVKWFNINEVTIHDSFENG